MRQPQRAGVGIAWSRVGMLGWGVIGLLGLVTFIHLYDQAFPEAAIHFAKSRGEILDQARGFLNTQRHPLNPGQGLEDYQESLIFTSDTRARIFLERTLGLSAANALTRNRVKVWMWHGRWFRPLQKEEYQVSIAPDGELIGYHHSVEETRQGAWLDPETAQRLAIQWVTQRLYRSLAGYPLVDERHTERPHRMDHTFVWEEPGFTVHGAAYRTRVTVAGDQVTEFTQFLKVPERWLQEYTQEQSKGYVTTVLLTGGYGLLGLCVLGVFLYTLKQRVPHWRLIAVVGTGLAAIRLASEFNAWPLAKHGIETTQPIASAYVGMATAAFLASGATALTAAILVIAGRFLASRVWGDSPTAQLAPSLTRQGTQTFLHATCVGYGLAGAHLAYVSVFYLLSFHWGAWAPSDTTQYQNSFATWLPWLFPLTVGLSASVHEELTFRLFGVTLCQWVFRRRWLAVLLPGLLWAFLHSSYPQFPFYIRGVELVLPAVVSGWVFIRYGILATIIWHYAYDAFLVALPLLRSSSPYFMWSGWLVVGGLAVLPLGVWLALSLRQTGRAGNRTRQVSRSQRGLVVRQAVASLRVIPGYLRIQTQRFFNGAGTVAVSPIGIALTVLGVLGLTLWLFHLQGAKLERQEGGLTEVSVTRPQALAIARHALRSRGVNLHGWYPATHVDTADWEWELRYLGPRIGIQTARQLLFQEFPLSQWHIEWIKPGSRESYDVWLLLKGTVADISHTLPEEAPGEALSASAAQQRVRGWLRIDKRLDLADWRLVNTASEALPHRVDHIFTWERQGTSLGDARLRMDVTIAGGEWTGFSKYLYLPEGWLRQQELQRLRQTIAWSLLACLGTGICLVLGWMFIQYARRVQLRWRAGLVVASATSLGALVQHLNEWPNFFTGYSASLSLLGFSTVKLLGWLRDVAGLFALTLIVSVFVEAWIRDVGRAPGGLLRQFQRPWQDSISFREWVASGWGVVTVTFAVVGISHAAAWITQRVAPEATGGFPLPGVTSWIADACPAVGILAESLTVTMVGMLSWMLGVCAVTLIQRRWRAGGVMLGGILLCGLYAMTEASWAELWVSLARGIAILGVLWAGMVQLAPRNLWVVAAWVLAIVTGYQALPLISEPHPASLMQGMAALAVGVMPCAWLASRALERLPGVRPRVLSTPPPWRGRKEVGGAPPSSPSPLKGEGICGIRCLTPTRGLTPGKVVHLRTLNSDPKTR